MCSFRLVCCNFICSIHGKTPFRSLFSRFICLIHFFVVTCKPLPAITGCGACFLHLAPKKKRMKINRMDKIQQNLGKSSSISAFAQLFHTPAATIFPRSMHPRKYIESKHRAINFITYFSLIATQQFKLFSDWFSHSGTPLSSKFSIQLLIVSQFLHFRFVSFHLRKLLAVTENPCYTKPASLYTSGLLACLLPFICFIYFACSILYRLGLLPTVFVSNQYWLTLISTILLSTTNRKLKNVQ